MDVAYATSGCKRGSAEAVFAIPRRICDAGLPMTGCAAGWGHPAVNWKGRRVRAPGLQWVIWHLGTGNWELSRQREGDVGVAAAGADLSAAAGDDDELAAVDGIGGRGGVAGGGELGLP